MTALSRGGPRIDAAAPLHLEASARGGWRQGLRVLTRNRLVLIGLILSALVLVTAGLADLIAPYDPIKNNVRAALQEPSATYWFGTDRFGRDIFSRVIYASRASLLVATSSTLMAVLAGTALGLMAGYFGGWIDNAIGRLFDVLFSFPSLLLAIAISAMLGPSLNNAIIALSVVYTPLLGRVVRGAVLVERHKEYVEAARVLGAAAPRVMVRHVLPNTLSPLTVQATVTFSFAILQEATLSYLGLGTQPPHPSWGTMLSDGRTLLETAPWLSIFPGLAIVTAVLAFNLLGDGIRDALDPRARGEN